jgi:hypothetical protein
LRQFWDDFEDDCTLILGQFWSDIKAKFWEDFGTEFGTNFEINFRTNFEANFALILGPFGMVMGPILLAATGAVQSHGGLK